MFRKEVELPNSANEESLAELRQKVARLQQENIDAYSKFLDLKHEYEVELYPRREDSEENHQRWLALPAIYQAAEVVWGGKEAAHKAAEAELKIAEQEGEQPSQAIAA